MLYSIVSLVTCIGYVRWLSREVCWIVIILLRLLVNDVFEHISIVHGYWLSYIWIGTRYLNVYKCIQRVINWCGSDLEVYVVKDSGGDRKGKRGSRVQQEIYPSSSSIGLLSILSTGLRGFEIDIGLYNVCKRSNISIQLLMLFWDNKGHNDDNKEPKDAWKWHMDSVGCSLLSSLSRIVERRRIMAYKMKLRWDEKILVV